MLIKYTTDYYDIDKIDKFSIIEEATDDWGSHSVITLYFIQSTWWSSLPLAFTSVKNKKEYDEIFSYLMKKWPIIETIDGE